MPEEDAPYPCVKCGRTDLPLFYNRMCPECYDPEMTELLWEGNPVTIIVDPSGMTLHAYDEEKVKQIRKDYDGVKVLASKQISNEVGRRWKEARTVNVEEFTGSVEILSKQGTQIAEFSGSDEYSGTVCDVWKITVKTEKGGKVWQLWTRN